MSLKHYYEKELSMLYEEAHRFAKQFPEQASALNLEKNKTQDPHVARLLEGCAFLTAKIHQMIHEESDHLPEQLIQRLWPQLSQGFPSSVMVQARPALGLTQTQRIPKGSFLSSSAVGDEKTVCQFQTLSDLEVSPIELASVKHYQGEDEALTLGFQSFGSCKALTLDLFIDTKNSKALTLIHYLLSTGTRMTACLNGVKIDTNEIRISLPALDPKRVSHPQQLLFEIYCFPEKIQWVQVKGNFKCERGDELTISFTSHHRIDHAYQFTREDIKLCCVPAINLFEHDAEPIMLDHKHHRYALSADHHRPESMRIQSVITARGFTEINQAPIQYKPLHHILDVKESYYVYDSQGYLSFNTSHLIKQTVSVKAKACNHHYPRRYLKAESLSLADKSLDSLVKITNIHQPSAYLPEPSSHKKSYLLQLLRVKIESIHSVEQLKLTLRLHNRSENEAILQKIDSIQTLKINKRALIKRGVFHHVHVIEMGLNDDGFTSISDKFVFGMILHAYFQACAPITTVVETKLIFNPSESMLSWIGHHE